MVLEQAPPSNLEAETTVIASILVDPEALSRVASFLQPEDFFERRHAAMYRAALTLGRAARGDQPDHPRP